MTNTNTLLNSLREPYKNYVLSITKGPVSPWYNEELGVSQYLAQKRISTDKRGQGFIDWMMTHHGTLHAEAMDFVSQVQKDTSGQNYSLAQVAENWTLIIKKPRNAAWQKFYSQVASAIQQLKATSSNDSKESLRTKARELININGSIINQTILNSTIDAWGVYLNTRKVEFHYLFFIDPCLKYYAQVSGALRKDLWQQNNTTVNSDVEVLTKSLVSKFRDYSIETSSDAAQACAYALACLLVESFLNIHTESPKKPIDPSKMSLFDLIGALEKHLYQEVDRIYKSSPIPSPEIALLYWKVPHQVLNYLSKEYLKSNELKWVVSVEGYNKGNANLLETDPQTAKITQALDKYIGAKRQLYYDKIGGYIDVAHMAVTTLAYLNANVVPSRWVGWAGDLATGIKNVEKIIHQNPAASLSDVAEAMIGAPDNNWKQHKNLQGLNLEGVENDCNYSDLCSDGDAIVLSERILKMPQGDQVLTNVLKSYYSDSKALENRYIQIAWSEGAKDKNTAAEAFYKSVTTNFPDVILQNMLTGEVEEKTIRACCNALASFIFR